MTAAERRASKAAARAYVLGDIEREVKRCDFIARFRDPCSSHGLYRHEIARLWRVALRAVKAEATLALTRLL